MYVRKKAVEVERRVKADFLPEYTFRMMRWGEFDMRQILVTFMYW